MPSMAALEAYIHDTSSTLFALGARIMGRQSEGTEHLARHAGFAQGMVHVIASLPADVARRQLFVPLQVLESHGSGMEEVFAGKETPQLRAALDQMIGEAAVEIGQRAGAERLFFRDGLFIAAQPRAVGFPVRWVGQRLKQPKVDVHRLERAWPRVDGLDMAAGDMAEQRPQRRGRRR